MPTDADDLLLDDGARLVHIGPQKTGSTALQAALRARRKQMRTHGVRAVGLARRERLALWAALMHHGSQEPRYRDDFELWARVVDELTTAPGRAVLSHESLGKAEDADAQRMVGQLGGPRVHVLAVARRLDRLLPSQWQQRVKTNAITHSYEEWLRIVLGDDQHDPVWRNLWVPHDLGPLVARWSSAAGPERFTLLIADEADRLRLPRTVERMLGLPPGLLRPEEGHKTNASLSLDRLELLREINRLQASETGAPDSAWAGTARKAVKNVAPVPGERRAPSLPRWARTRVVELSEARADAVRRLGVRVLGDPDLLRVRPEELDEADDHVPQSAAARLTALVLREVHQAEPDRPQEPPAG